MAGPGRLLLGSQALQGVVSPAALKAAAGQYRVMPGGGLVGLHGGPPQPPPFRPGGAGPPPPASGLGGLRPRLNPVLPSRGGYYAPQQGGGRGLAY